VIASAARLRGWWRALGIATGLATSVAIVSGLAGCAAPAGPQAMVVQSPAATAPRQHPSSVSVTVLGGAETGALDSSNIGNADLQNAIEASIRESRLFREVLHGRGGLYELAVSVIQLNKPTFGTTFTVELEAGWSLTRGSDRTVLWRKVVKSSGTSTMGEAFVGVTRLRLAVEAAARSNIQQGLADIATLDLQATPEIAAAAPLK